MTQTQARPAAATDGDPSGALTADTLHKLQTAFVGSSAYRLAQNHKVVTPVIAEVYAMLYDGKDVRRAVRDLMSRDLKSED